MQRISIVGNSGSGKTIAARRLATLLDVPHVELDAIFHQPGWQELPTPDFRERVAHLVEGPGWVIDGNREPWSNVCSLDPRRSIIAWAWTQHASYRGRYADAMADDANAHLRFERITDDAGLTALFTEAASARRT